jgi:TldD protein
MTTRRDFLATTGLAASALALTARRVNATGTRSPILNERTEPDPQVKVLLLVEALTAAKLAGASWADARIQRQRRQNLGTREQQVTQVSDTDTIGCGVRVLVDGTWGFSATRSLTKDGVARAAKQAVALAKANRVARDRLVRLAPTDVHPNATWKSSYTIDPWSIAVEDKVALLMAANAEAMKVKNIRFVNSNLSFVKEERSYANSEGSMITQDVVRSWVTMSCTAVSDDRTETATRGPEVGAAGSTCSRTTSSRTPPCGRNRRVRNSPRVPSMWGAGISSCIPRSSSSPSTSRSRIRPNSTARWATKPTTRAPRSSHRPTTYSASCDWAPTT